MSINPLLFQKHTQRHTIHNYIYRQTGIHPLLRGFNWWLASMARYLFESPYLPIVVRSGADILIIVSL